MIKAQLETSDPDQLCAMAVITVTGGEKTGEREEKEGQSAGDWIGVALSLALGNDGIFVRYSDYKYIFFSETDSKYEIRRQTEDGFAYVRNVLGHIPQINQMRFVAGTVLRAAGRTEPATLLARRIACAACGKIRPWTV